MTDQTTTERHETGQQHCLAPHRPLPLWQHSVVKQLVKTVIGQVQFTTTYNHSLHITYLLLQLSDGFLLHTIHVLFHDLFPKALSSTSVINILETSQNAAAGVRVKKPAVNVHNCYS